MYEEPLSLIPFLQQEDFGTVEAFLEAAMKRIVAVYDTVYRAAIYHQLDDESITPWALVESVSVPYAAPPTNTFLRYLQAGAPAIDEEHHLILAPLRQGEQLRGLLALTYDGDAPALSLVIDLAAQFVFCIEYLEMRAARENATVIMNTFNDWILQSNQERDEKAILARAVTILRETTGCIKVAIVLFEDHQTTPHFVIEAGYPQRVIGLSLPDPDRTVSTLLGQAEPPLMVDVSAENLHLPEHFRDHLGRLETPLAAVFPMYDTHETLLGMVVLAYPQIVLQEEVLSVARTIIAQLTMTLQKTRLLREMQNQTAQMQRLTTFSEAMQASLYTPELLTILLERLPYLLPIDYCAVLLYDRKADGLRVAALSHNGENSVSTPGMLLEEDSNTIAQHTWETQEAIWINALQDTWTWQHPFVSQLQTILAAPLTSNGVRIGVLEIGSEQASQYSQTDMVAFEQVSSQVSVGLANAEAYSMSQQLARNKMLANDIVALLQRQMEVEDILRITASELGQALGATRARIRLGTDSRKQGENKS